MTRAWIHLFLGALLASPAVVLHGLGFREHTTFLSGAVPEAGMQAIPLGIAYLGSWFVAWWLAPVWLLSAGLLFVTAILREPARSAPPPASPTAPSPP